MTTAVYLTLVSRCLKCNCFKGAHLDRECLASYLDLGEESPRERRLEGRQKRCCDAPDPRGLERREITITCIKRYRAPAARGV